MWHLFFLFAHDLLKKALPCVPEWQKQRFYWEHMDDLGTRLGKRMKTKCLMLGVQLSGIHRSISGRSWRQWRLPRGCFKSKEHVEVQTLHVSFSWENIHGLKIPWLSPSLSLSLYTYIYINYMYRPIQVRYRARFVWCEGLLSGLWKDATCEFRLDMSHSLCSDRRGCWRTCAWPIAQWAAARVRGNLRSKRPVTSLLGWPTLLLAISQWTQVPW